MVTGCVVAILTAGTLEEVDSQLPLYVPPVVIVIGPDHVVDGGAGAGAEHAAVVAWTDVFGELFPAASLATTSKVYCVPQARPVWLALVPETVATTDPARYTS
jgi:hypothetical protein